MVDALGDYVFNKSADATSLNSASLTALPSFVRLEGGGDTTGSGAGGLSSSASINGKEDIGFFDEDGNPLDYYWVNFDTSSDVYEAFVLTDLVRDGTQDLKAGYGSGSTDDSSSKEAVWDATTADVHFNMNETSGAMIDSTSNNRDGSINNGFDINRGVASQFQEGYDFTGGDGYVKLNGYQGIGGSNVRTHNFWFKSNDTSLTAHSWIKYGTDSNSEKYFIRGHTQGGDVYLRIENAGGNYYDLSYKLNDQNWHMLTVVFPSGASDVGDHKLYIDGRRPNSTGGASQTVDTGKKFDVHIGNNIPGPNQHGPTDGIMDEVEIHSAELSGNRVQTKYDMSPKAGYSLFSWNASKRTSTKVTATPALGTATTLTAQTTTSFGNWTGFDDGNTVERSETNVSGEFAQKWEVDPSLSNQEKARFESGNSLVLDASNALDTRTGFFSNGCFGLHFRIDDKSALADTDSFRFEAGSSNTDKAVWTLDKSDLGPDEAFEYLTFSNKDYDRIEGIPNWENTSYFRVELNEKSGNSTQTFIFIDLLTLGSGDEIGANPLGGRKSNKRDVI